MVCFSASINSPIKISLTRWWNVVLKHTAPGLADHELVRQGWVAIPLTIQIPEVISYRKVPILRYPLRKEELCCGGGRTTRKITNTITSLASAVRQATPHAYPMISSRAKHIRSIAGGAVNSAKGDANHMAYLVRQGQEEVIEENGGDRN
jgi:hypothetical protein